MRQDKKLMLGMAILFFITFVSLGTLVVTEKLAPFYTDKIKENMINNNLDNINVYDIELSIPAKLKATNMETIVNDINTTVTNLHSININPNHYTINIKSDEERRMLTIYDLTDATLQKDSLTHVLNYIMIDNEKEEITEGEKIVDQYSLSYEYIRYGDEEDE